MRWPWFRDRTAPEEPSDDAEEAAQARLTAERKLESTKALRSEVADLAAQLRRHRQANHFAELFGESLGRR